MKINGPRFFLITGLAFALNHPFILAKEVNGSKSHSLRIAQAPHDLAPTPVPLATDPAPAQTPGWKPTPLSPPAVSPAPTPDPSLNSVPQPSTLPPVTPVPMPLGTKPNLSPADRPPLGLFYGEQERLDDLAHPERVKPRPLPTVPYPGSVSSTPAAVDGSATAAQPAVDRFGFAPPPGTLGQTYKRRTRVIDDNKHPRVGIVEVQLPEGVDVSATGLKSKWTGKVWRLESEPLLPGIPHIYEIKASWGEGTEPQVRTVRLIMGRIVDLEF